MLTEESEAIEKRPERTGKEKGLSKKKMTLETICNGEVQEAIDRALIKAAENIADPNMDRKAPRSVTIQIIMKPHEKDPEDVAVSVKVSKKLAAEQPFETGFFVTKDLRSGAVMIQEHGRGQIKGQLSLDDYEEVDEETGEVTINRATFAEQNIKVKVTEKASEKKDTNLTASGITTTYNVNKNLVITLKDSAGKALSGLKITVDLNGAKNYTTDSNGQVKIAVGKLVPKTYTAKISFAGNDKYAKSNTTAKVTVKKASPKITAKAKTFKFEDETKKYTVTLKDNKGNALKNKKVTLKVNGKTYTAKTNNKGVATFKLTKLTKKGTYSAVITYAGDKYYKKVTKKAKVTVKAPAWKTVSKGSKDKAMVKKIQRALKNNGYYLNYNGRYLKVDGIFEKYTEMAVKQFQKDKGLKVTGKVDYATAKKLKIVS